MFTFTNGSCKPKSDSDVKTEEVDTIAASGPVLPTPVDVALFQQNALINIDMESELDISNNSHFGDTSFLTHGYNNGGANGSAVKLDDLDGSPSSRSRYSCDICHMQFSQKANMQRHRQRHSGVKPYQCKVCLKRFFRKDHMQEHMVVHIKGTERFECPLCADSFAAHTALRSHINSVHGREPGPKRCKLCATNFATAKRLIVHYQTKHLFDGATELISSEPGENGGERHHAATDVEIDGDGEERSKRRRARKPSKPSQRASSAAAGSGAFSLSGDVVLPFPVPVSVANLNFGRTFMPNASFHSDEGADASNQRQQQLMQENGCFSPLDKDGVEFTLEGAGNGGANGSDSQSPSIDGSASGTGNGAGAGMEVFLPGAPAGWLLRHMLDGGGGTRNGAGLLRCECAFCGIAFTDPTLYFLHKGLHAESDPWKCNLCGSPCGDKYAFHSHLISANHG